MSVGGGVSIPSYVVASRTKLQAALEGVASKILAEIEHEKSNLQKDGKDGKDGSDGNNSLTKLQRISFAVVKKFGEQDEEEFSPFNIFTDTPESPEVVCKILAEQITVCIAYSIYTSVRLDRHKVKGNGAVNDQQRVIFNTRFPNIMDAISSFKITEDPLELSCIHQMIFDPSEKRRRQSWNDIGRGDIYILSPTSNKDIMDDIKRRTIERETKVCRLYTCINPVCRKNESTVQQQQKRSADENTAVTSICIYCKTPAKRFR